MLRLLVRPLLGLSSMRCTQASCVCSHCRGAVQVLLHVTFADLSVGVLQTSATLLELCKPSHAWCRAAESTAR